MMKKLTCVTLLAGAMLWAADTVPAPATGKTFSTPEEAVAAMTKAASEGLPSLKTLLGPASDGLLRTGDDVADRNRLDKFIRQATEKTKLDPDELNPNNITVLIGEEEWPLAIPLVRKNGRWYFDVVEGKAEVRRRIIGANELDAIEVCRGYVEAQLMYAEADRDGNGVLEYAKKIVSTEGKKDGLYWPGEDSPISAGFAKAAAQGYTGLGSGSGYHGYAYKILLAQGPDAQDGAEDYVAHGFMIGGFALIAWPVQYGSSGIMSFIVNQDGVVYEKDLGEHTGVLARAMSKFNPDKSWRPSAW